MPAAGSEARLALGRSGRELGNGSRFLPARSTPLLFLSVGRSSPKATEGKTQELSGGSLPGFRGNAHYGETLSESRLPTDHCRKLALKCITHSERPVKF